MGIAFFKSVAVVLALSSSLPAAAETLAVMVASLPGLVNGTDGGNTVTGPVVELLDKIAQESGMQFAYRLAPTARIRIDVQRQPQTCGALAKTSRLESLFQWIGPIGKSDVVVYSRASDERVVTRLDELGPMRLVVLRDSGPSDLLRELGLRATEVASPDIAMRMLQANRVDAWASIENVAQSTVKHATATPLRPLFNLPSVEVYIACNRQVAVDSISSMNMAVTKMRRAGQLAMFGLK